MKLQVELGGAGKLKKTIFENYRVEVSPDIWYGPSHEKYLDALNDLKKDIVRHVDGIEDVSVQWDSKEVCEFCECEWELWEEEDEKEEGGFKKGIPVCCDKAQKEAVCKSHIKELNGDEKCQT